MTSLLPAAQVDCPQLKENRALQGVFAALGADRARVVGGAVRAAVLGEGVGDIDVCTTLTPDAVTEKLGAAGFKVIPTGLDHGTVTAVLDGQTIEVTTLRRDVATDGRRAVVAFTTDWLEDAQRRDFTMNTLLMDQTGQVYDPTGQGISDLKNGIVRFVGDPETRIMEDALRILRFFRFHARYGKNDPASEGRDACVHRRDLIETLSRERITAEVEKLLPAAQAGFSIMSMIAGGIMGDLWYKKFDRAAYEVGRNCVISRGLPFAETLLLAYCAYDPDVKILDEKIKKYFVFSNKKTTFLKSCIAYVTGPAETLKQSLYRYGSDITSAGIILAHLINAKGADLQTLIASLDVVAKTPVPVLPVAAADIMQATGLQQGKALGDVLKKTEAWWLGQNCEPDHIAALDYAKSVVQT